MPGSRPVLVLDADPGFAATISKALAADGWMTQVATNPADARLRLCQSNPHIAVVDLGLPAGGGIAFAREAARAGLGVVAPGNPRGMAHEIELDDVLAMPALAERIAARVRALSPGWAPPCHPPATTRPGPRDGASAG